MRDMAATAERLRAARKARGEFFDRWLVEHLILGPMLLDRLARALARMGGGSAGRAPRLHPGRPADEEGR